MDNRTVRSMAGNCMTRFLVLVGRATASHALRLIARRAPGSFCTFGYLGELF